MIAASRRSTTSAMSPASGSSCAPTSTCRLDGRTDHRRLPHPGGAAHDRLADSSAARRSCAPATSAGRRASPTRSTRWRRCEPASPNWRPASSCWRTCASIPARRPTSPASRRALIEGIDLYVNDAFGASHRAHASIVGPPQALPSAMGLLLQKEVEVLLGLRNNPKRPFVAVLGGAKISDKLGVVEALLDVVDSLVDRRRDVLHVLRRPGQVDRRLAVRARPGRDVRAAPRSVRARRSTCPRTSSASTPTATFATFGHRRCPTARKGSTSVPARPPRSAT